MLQWTLCGRYCTAGGQWYCSFNGVCYSKHYMEDSSQQVDSIISGWKNYITVNIMWKILHSRWTVILQGESSVLQWTLCGSYWKAGGQCYCSLNGICYCEYYVELTAQWVDSFIGAWMDCVTVIIMWKLLQCRWTVILHLEWIVLQLTLCGGSCREGGQ